MTARRPLFLLLALWGCSAPKAAAGDASPEAAVAAVVASSESETLPPPVQRGEQTSPVARSVPVIADAVAALVHTIAGYKGKLGVAVLDVGSGEVIAAYDDRRMLNPASTAKLFTAATALARLHGNHRFETGLYGEQKGGSVARIVLRGQGDPSLSTKDLWDMVHDLRDIGVKRIEGDILVDQRYFDESFVPPAFDQQPNEWAYFRAPVSAIALNENTITMTVRPSAADSPAFVSFDPPGFVDVDGTVKTTGEDTPQSVRLELSPNGPRLSAKIGGTIPDKAKTIGFARRADSPMMLAGYALKALLVSAGIAVGGDVKPGGEGQKHALVVHRSSPLSEILYELGKHSNNFYAEMVFKTLGAEKKGRPGRSVDGGEIVVKYLTEIGAYEEGTVIKNGSGLYDANRVSPSETAKLLRAAYRDSAISPEFVAELAVGGVDGTLHGRFKSSKDRRAVRAKTGTLESIVALSGYVLGPPAKAPVAFSIIVNEVAGKVFGARAAIDLCVDAIVRWQWQNQGEARAKRTP
jgi:serine-type D-Ala-D-Ala carboxypeptidase/endopeptidase (penicillin-binding protein 4)